MFTVEDLSSVKKIYLASFPEEERRPWPDLYARLLSGEIRLDCLRDEDGCIIGFATVWHFPAFAYVEHLAVDGNARGLGVGGRLLDKVVKRENVPVIVEVEPAPTGENAKRRIGFYERYGFTAYPTFGYIQPPYAVGLPAVPLMLMASNPIGENQLSEISNTLHRVVYGKES